MSSHFNNGKGWTECDKCHKVMSGERDDTINTKDLYIVTASIDYCDDCK